jgi:hypothetical protein
MLVQNYRSEKRVKSLFHLLSHAVAEQNSAFAD